MRRTGRRPQSPAPHGLARGTRSSSTATWTSTSRLRTTTFVQFAPARVIELDDWIPGVTQSCAGGLIAPPSERTSNGACSSCCTAAAGSAAPGSSEAHLTPRRRGSGGTHYAAARIAESPCSRGRESWAFLGVRDFGSKGGCSSDLPETPLEFPVSGEHYRTYLPVALVESDDSIILEDLKGFNKLIGSRGELCHLPGIGIAESGSDGGLRNGFPIGGILIRGANRS